VTLVAIAVIAVAFAARAAVAASQRLAVLDADQAVTGIVAQRIGAGEAFPPYFPGQAYMGTLEQYLQAPILLVAPDTKLTLQILGAALGAATAVLVLMVGRRVTGSPWGGVLAAAVFAVWPLYSLTKGVSSHGAYAAGTLIALASLALAFRLEPRTRAAPLVAAGLGLAAGLVVWELWLGAFLLIPALVWALPAVRRDPGLLLAAGAGAVVGAAPFLIHRLGGGWGQDWSAPAPPGTTVTSRAEALFDPVLGLFLGVGRPDGSGVLSWLSPRLVVIAALLALAVALWRRRRGLLALVTLREEGRAPVDAVLLAFIVAGPLYILAKATWYTAEPRYLFTLYPAVALAVAAGVCALPRREVRIGVAAVLLAGMVALTVVQTREELRKGPVTFTLVGAGTIDMARLPDDVAELEAMGVREAWADYWLAYPIVYLSGGDVSVAPFTHSRFPHLLNRVRDDPDAPLIAPEGAAADGIRAALEETDTTYTERVAGQLVVFSDLSPAVTPRELGLRPCVEDCDLTD
jgi:hypothetical protein